MIDRPVAGVHYPGSLPAVRAWFGSDADCMDFLDWLRWPDGFECPWCEGTDDRGTQPGTHRCATCRRHVSVTAGTIFHKTRTPLTVWFEAAWLFTASKQGLSALELQRVTGLGSYQTAWTMLHRFRAAMTSDGRQHLSGQVEVDESFIGGADQPGGFGRSGLGKTLIIAAVERPSPRSYGRIRLQKIDNAALTSIRPFLEKVVTPGSTIVTDAWTSYPPAAAAVGLVHKRHNVSTSGKKAHELLPGVHLVFSLLKRVLDTTYQGAIQTEHLQAYLDEFTFRFNRRHAKQRGMLFFRLLESAVATSPLTYRNIATGDDSGDHPAMPRASRHRKPPTLAGPRAQRPWRAPHFNNTGQLNG